MQVRSTAHSDDCRLSSHRQELASRPATSGLTCEVFLTLEVLNASIQPHEDGDGVCEEHAVALTANGHEPFEDPPFIGLKLVAGRQG